MNKFLIAALSSAILSGSLTTAHADNAGPVTAIDVAPGNAIDNRSCMMFQTNLGTTWYAIPSTDANYSAEASLVLYAFTSGITLNFNVDGPLCNHTQVSGLYIGNAQ
jgi:hypothetical protein